LKQKKRVLDITGFFFHILY